MYLLLSKTSVWMKLPKPNTGKYFILNKLNHSKENDENKAGQLDEKQGQDSEIVQVPTTTTVELHEPLLKKQTPE